MASDSILRMIEQVAMMIAGIIARKQRGDLAGAAKEIEEKCLKNIGLPLIVIRQSTPEAVAELLDLHLSLRTTRRVNPDHTIECDGKCYEISPTLRKRVTVVFHPFRRFWVLDQAPKYRWPTILGSFTL